MPVAITSPGDVVNGWKGTLRLESAKAFQVTAHKRRRRLALGRKGFDVRAARTMVVEVKISKSNRHLLTRLGHLDVTATAVAKDGNGDGVTVSATFRLRPPARRRRKSRR
ncbi:MAG: hypothetical protein DLM61_02570 [Pseudonocardiales bacterium]|nr:MAG: hypothetical protein DLM61_02570 [Pseudonocardiales bacterium]